MSKVEEFLTEEEEKEIVEAIKEAERNTSGEIRVHLDSTVKADALKHAKKMFERLQMHKTKSRNGVLIYIAVESKVFVIYGDKGIHEVVPEGFWDSTKDIMQTHFKEGDFKNGIIQGIKMAGEELKKYFPWKRDDSNELPDEISRS